MAKRPYKRRKVRNETLGLQFPEETSVKPKANISEPIDLEVSPKDYEPSKAEMEEEFVPGVSDEELRETFFRPVKIARDE